MGAIRKCYSKTGLLFYIVSLMTENRRHIDPYLVLENLIIIHALQYSALNTGKNI